MWWYYLNKAWWTKSPRDAWEITKDMVIGNGDWGSSMGPTHSASGYSPTSSACVVPPGC